MASDWQGVSLGFAEAPEEFRGPTQRARFVTEAWAASSMFCPSCQSDRLEPFLANRPVADLYCPSCEEQFELKSKKGPFAKKLANGAYRTKIDRLQSDTSPNLILLQYSQPRQAVVSVTAIPKRFFVPSIVEKRKPLAATARRAGWVGSNILLDRIPKAGRVPLIFEGQVRPKALIREDWKRTAFLDEKPLAGRGWLVEVMACVDRIGRESFALEDVYRQEATLQALYPGNNNVRPKIRQQLQVLRDEGYLEFLGDGEYRLL